MKKARLITSIVFTSVLMVFSLVISITESLAFFKTWGFTALDMVFIAVALILFLHFFRIEIVFAFKRKTSQLIDISGSILMIAWLLADWVIFPKDSRISNLIDALWFLPFTGLFMGWLYTSWKRIRNIVTEEPQHSSVDVQ